MDVDADPAELQRVAGRLGALSGDVQRVADRLDDLAVGDHGARPGAVAIRCAALVMALRSDAAQMSECEELMRRDRSGLLAGEESVLAQIAGLDRRLRELSRWRR